MSKEYENYVFDLYGTLVDIRTDEEPLALWEKVSLFYSYYGAYYKAEELKEAYAAGVRSREKTQQVHDSHESYPEVQIEYVFQQLFLDKGVEADLTLAMHTGQFFRVLSTEYVKLYPGAHILLKELRDKGKKVYLLSNAQRIFTEYELKSLDIFQYFNGILISSEYGCKKPDSRFFHLLEKEFQVDFANSLMIGNDAKSDIQGAKDVGMDTFYIHSNISPELIEQPQSTYFLDYMDLEKVRKILQEK